MRRGPAAGALLAGVLLLAACGSSPTAPTTSERPSDAASVVKPSRSPSPTRTTRSPSPTPSSTPTPSATPTPSPTPSPSAASPRPTAVDGGEPVWYPNWTADGGKGDAQPWLSAWPSPVVVAPTASGPLDGRVIAIDPGHNIGNSTHSSQINKHYWVGLDKICNTTGTATASGYEEASYTFDVAQRLAASLAAQGATVHLTRDVNSTDTYGPCIQARGLFGGQVGADLEVSIHADGGPSSGRGAFVYTPGEKQGYTDAEKAARSVRLAESVLAGLDGEGLRGSTYLRPNIAPDVEQGTLNTATIPTVIVETLNMANSQDASIAESKAGRQRVADGLLAGILQYLA